MSLVVALSADGVRMPLPRKRVSSVARLVLRSQRVRSALLSITFVSNRGIARMNREHLGRNEVSDVIAFGFRRTQGTPVIGDVYIAPDVARRSARSNGISPTEEIVRLVVHGTLHVLGEEHPEGAARTRSPMWRKQERLVRRAMDEVRR